MLVGEPKGDENIEVKQKVEKKHLVSKELWCLSSSLETHQMRGLGQPPNSAGDCE